jgi:hypothetical protein
LDEGLKHDTRSIVQGSPVESRAEEAREQEGPGDGEPTPDARLTGDRADRARGENGDQPTLDEVEDRAELARHLDRSVFPARPLALVESARRHHAPAWIEARLASLPDRVFDTTEQVWEALGGARERRP